MYELIAASILAAFPRRNKKKGGPLTSATFSQRLAPDQYRAFVGYEDIPSRAVLMKKFRLGVASIFDFEKYGIHPHEEFKHLVEKPGVKEFWVCRCRKFITSTEVIWMARLMGYRPATFKELLAFIAARPRLGPKILSIVALGSFTNMQADGSRYVPKVRIHGRARMLGSAWYGRAWDEDDYFLLVRE